MTTALIKQASKVIKKIQYLNIASITKDGKPWNTPVYCAYDTELNFYWISWKENQHSKNIKNNSSVFVTIYDSSVPAGTGFGVYFQGKAKELSNPKELLIGLSSVYGREKRKPKDIINFIKKLPRRVCRCTPESVWVNGDSEID